MKKLKEHKEIAKAFTEFFNESRGLGEKPVAVRAVTEPRESFSTLIPRWRWFFQYHSGGHASLRAWPKDHPDPVWEGEYREASPQEVAEYLGPGEN